MKRICCSACSYYLFNVDIVLLFQIFYYNKKIKMNSIFLKSEPKLEIDPVDDIFSEEAIKVSFNVVNNWVW